MYLEKLGLIVEPIEEYENGYVFSVPYLQRADSDEYYEVVKPPKDKFFAAYDSLTRHYTRDIAKGYRDENYREAALYAITRMYHTRYLYPLFSDLLEVLYEYRLYITSLSIDMHDGNFRMCPITGKIFVYDPIAAWGYIH